MLKIIFNFNILTDKLYWLVTNLPVSHKHQSNLATIQGITNQQPKTALDQDYIKL